MFFNVTNSQISAPRGVLCMFCIAVLHCSNTTWEDSKVGNHTVPSENTKYAPPCNSNHVVQHKVNNSNMHLIRGTRYRASGRRAGRFSLFLLLMQELPNGDCLIEALGWILNFLLHAFRFLGSWRWRGLVITFRRTTVFDSVPISFCGKVLPQV